MPRLDTFVEQIVWNALFVQLHFSHIVFAYYNWMQKHENTHYTMQSQITVDLEC